MTKGPRMDCKIAFTATLLLMTWGTAAQGIPNPCPNAKPVPPELRLPPDAGSGNGVAFQKKVLAYLNTLEYRKLGWCEDKWVRDTGPFINSTEVGVHPPVRLYYSPEVVAWLLNGRQGAIADGAVIIKEQFPSPPAARYRDIAADKLGCANDWTFMIKNAAASKDGWFWGEVWNSPPMSDSQFQYPNVGYGLYCLNCHSSAQKEHTFASLSNIKGAPGWPLQFRVDDSWRSVAAAPPPAQCNASGHSAAEPLAGAPFPRHAQNAALGMKVVSHKLAAVPLLSPKSAIQRMPSESLDNVVAAATAPQQFVTSSQCLGCHSGLAPGGFGPAMTLPSNINVSPYGEWRWSPMGLAGRDPVFYSQLDAELDSLKDPAKKQLVIDTCMTCHGAMGKKTFAIEHPGKPFNKEVVYDADPKSPGFKYGGLARDGISCMVCHHMAKPSDPSLSYFLTHKINGEFDLTPPDQVSGPFRDQEITTYPMEQALGIKPKYDPYIQSSQMCGSCHTIQLPVLDSPDPSRKSLEQVTYVEWLNSSYRNEYGSVGETPKSCQDCHMPQDYVNTAVSVPQIQTRIAIVQDTTYPATEGLARPDQVNVRYRPQGYRRHAFLGLNGFLLELFQETAETSGVNAGNNTILGVRLKDYMTGFTSDLQNAIDNVVQLAQSGTATIALSKTQLVDGKLIAEVTVTNLAGHRFPSGVGFRRAFIEFQARINGKKFWSSGRTNEKGEIIDDNNQVLASEYFQKCEPTTPPGACSYGQQYQPHFSQSTPIRSSSQVQIYEELVQNAEHQFTTSFTRRDFDVKDNRLLPKGWKERGPSDLRIPAPFLEATLPKGSARRDPVYLGGNGQSVVRYEIPLPPGASASNITTSVSLYSQATPPHFLADRYRTPGPATARLQHLNTAVGSLAGTNFENWKLLVARSQPAN